MTSVRRRRLAAASLAATALLTLSACGTGFDAQTNQQYQPGIGANDRGPFNVLNTLLVANEDGSATLSAAIVNKTGKDASLSSVTMTDLDGTELAVRSTKILLPVPNGVLVPVGGSGDAGGFVVPEGALAGDYVRVTLTFTSGSPVTIEAPVVPRTEEYAKVAGGDGLAPSDVSGDSPTDEPSADAEDETETEPTE